MNYQEIEDAISELYWLTEMSIKEIAIELEMSIKEVNQYIKNIRRII